MIKIKGAQRTRFAKLYRQILHKKHLTSSQIAKQTRLNTGWLYNTVSPSNTKAITLKRAMRVIKELPLTRSQSKALICTIIYSRSQRLRLATKAKLNGMSAPRAAKKYHVGISTIYRYVKEARDGRSSVNQVDEAKHKRIYQATQAKLRGMSVSLAAEKYHVSVSSIYHHTQRVKNDKHVSRNTRFNESNPRHPRQLNLQSANQAKALNSVVKDALKRWDHGTVVLYKPIHNHKPSPLAENIKNHMASEQMNMRTLTYRTGLNRKRIHEFFNGKRQVLPRLTVFRLALGLNLKAHDLLRMNHANVRISKSIVSGHHPTKQSRHEPNHVYSSQLIDIVKKLDNNDVKLILPIAERLLKSEN